MTIYRLFMPILLLISMTLGHPLPTFAGAFDPPTFGGDVDYDGKRFKVKDPSFRGYKTRLFIGNLLLKPVDPDPPSKLPGGHGRVIPDITIKKVALPGLLYIKTGIFTR